MSTTDIPTDASGLRSWLGALATKVNDHGEAVVTRDEVATFTKSLDQLSGSVAAIKRDAFERSTQAGSDNDLRIYCVVDRKDAANFGILDSTRIKSHPSKGTRHYMTSGSQEDAQKDAPIVRLYTHTHPIYGVMPGLLDDVDARNPWQRRIQAAVTKRNVVKFWMGGRDTPACDRAVIQLMACAPEPIRSAVQRTFTDATAYGAEWIDDGVVPDLIREMEFIAQLSSIWRQVNVSGSGSFRWPFLTLGLRPYIKAAPGAANLDPAQYAASAMLTDDRLYTPVTLAVRQLVYEEAAEDSFVAVFDIGVGELAKALSEGTDDGSINGDMTATHRDTIASWNINGRWGATGLGTAADHRRAFYGLRKRAAATGAEADGSGLQTGAGSASLRALCDHEGAMGEGMFLWSPKYFLTKALQFSDFFTWEKAGSAAPILTGMMGTEAGGLPGQVGFLYGQPCVVNRFVPADLNASGVYDGVTETKGVSLYVVRDRFMMVNKQGRRVEVAKDITRGVYNQVATVRTSFEGLDEVGTGKAVSVHFNQL